MANGTIGDDPFLDITIHQRDVYSPTVAKLVREIAALAGDKQRRHLAGLLLTDFSPQLKPDIKKLESILTEMRDTLLRDAKERGFEV